MNDIIVPLGTVKGVGVANDKVKQIEQENQHEHV